MQQLISEKVSQMFFWGLDNATPACHIDPSSTMTGTVAGSTILCMGCPMQIPCQLGEGATHLLLEINIYQIHMKHCWLHFIFHVFSGQMRGEQIVFGTGDRMVIFFPVAKRAMSQDSAS